MKYEIEEKNSASFNIEDCYYYNIFSNVNRTGSFVSLSRNKKNLIELGLNFSSFYCKIDICVYSIFIPQRQIDDLFSYVFKHYSNINKITITIANTENYLKKFLLRNKFETELIFHDVFGDTLGFSVMSRFKDA